MGNNLLWYINRLLSKGSRGCQSWLGFGLLDGVSVLVFGLGHIVGVELFGLH